MKRLLLIAAVAAAACTSPAVTPSGGQFAGLSGLAATSAGDRDLLFIASTGSDDLRALNLCTSPILTDGGLPPLPDGGPGVPDACPPAENLQFLPGPIRVLPAAIQTSDRPVRLTGARLTSADGSINGGAVIVGGAENALRVVDAKNLLDAEKNRAAAIPPMRLPIDAPAVDVVAANALSGAQEVGSVSVRAFAATDRGPAVPPELLVLDVRLDPATGNVQLPTVVQSCSLGAISPRKLAVTPGVNTAVYVADGATDGAVRVDVASIPAFVAGGAPPAPCTIAQQITAGGRPLRSIAVSPTYFVAGPNDSAGNPTVVRHPAGELIAGVTVDGGMIFMRTSDGTVLPVPPFLPSEAGPAMKPLAVLSGPAVLPLRDVAFLVPPAPNPPTCVGCTTVVSGGFSSAALQRTFNLVAAASNSDGGVYFFLPLERRFISDTRDGTIGNPLPAASVTQATLSPASTDPNAATIPATAPPALNTGVTPTASWRLQFHGPIPGLGRRGGTITSTASGTLLLTTTPADLTRWTGSPLTRLAPGDVAALIVSPAPGQQLCPDLASETQLRIELPIVKVNPGSIELATVPDSGGVKGFHPSTDPAAKCFPFGAIAEVRAAGSAPWVVLENADLRGRAGTNVLFSSLGRRADYPLIYDPAKPPFAIDDTEISFTIQGNDPVIGSTLNFVTTSGFTPTTARDTTLTQGLAEAVLVYNSPRSQNLIFSSISGANVLLKADPAALNTLGGIVSFR